MTDEREIPASTENHLDLSIVAVADRTTDVPVVMRATLEEDGQTIEKVVAVEPRRFRVRGQLPVPVMTSYLRLETEINDALASNSEIELERVLQVAHSRIVSELTVLEPDALAPFEREGVTVKPAIELDSSQILVFLAWLAGDVTVADRIHRALSAGASPAATPAADADADSEADDAAETEAAAAGPLASSERS